MKKGDVMEVVGKSCSRTDRTCCKIGEKVTVVSCGGDFIYVKLGTQGYCSGFKERDLVQWESHL